MSCARDSAAGSHYEACQQVGENWILRQVYRYFPQSLETYNCRTKFNLSLGMEYNGELYGFSSVKVKLVDSLIGRPFILSWIRPRTPMTRRFYRFASIYFEHFVL